MSNSKIKRKLINIILIDAHTKNNHFGMGVYFWGRIFSSEIFIISPLSHRVTY